MKCPTDAATLQISSREGIEIDFCPDCRGVWLDRGELDKLIDRATAAATRSAGPIRDRDDDRDLRRQDRFGDRDDRFGDRDDRFGDEDDLGYRGRGDKRRRSSFLGDIFDFG